jgi:glutamate racemase
MSLRVPAPRLIGIFDSGVGGLSVARALQEACPLAPLLYVADSGHAPYGERDPTHVVERSLRITDFLLLQGASLIVVACNTATAAAIEAMRVRHPHLALVGVEPGVKPAAQQSRNKRVGVMATTSTLQSPRFQSLVQRFAPDCHVHPVACAGLAAAIEQGEAGRATVDLLLDRYCAVLCSAQVDTVVLGCTHYPFVSESIARRLGPDVALLDTAHAVAQQAARLYASPVISSPLASQDVRTASLTLVSTGGTEVLERIARERLGCESKALCLQI